VRQVDSIAAPQVLLRNSVNAAPALVCFLDDRLGQLGEAARMHQSVDEEVVHDNGVEGASQAASESLFPGYRELAGLSDYLSVQLSPDDQGPRVLQCIWVDRAGLFHDDPLSRQNLCDRGR
jgi:hypothetical protein